MPNTAEFIALARTWIGVPYRASGSHRNGANCVGLIVGIVREIGFEEMSDKAAPYADFALPPESGSLLRGMKEYLLQIPIPDAAPGDIILLKIGTEPQHIVLITEPGIVLHADIHSGKVVEHKFPSTWRPLATFRIKELSP